MSDQEPADRMEDTIAAYVLGAVGHEEEEAVRAHLESSPGARGLERRLRRVVGELALGVEQTDPPPGLRTRILNAAGATAPARPHPSPRRGWRWWPAIRWPAPQWQQAWPRAATAALALMVMGLAGWNGYLSQQFGQANQPAGRYQLTATAPAFQGTRGQVLFLRSERLLMVDFNHLPALPPGHVYQVWLGDGHGKVVRGDYFIPDQLGSKVSVIDRDPTGYSELILTVEPGPTGSNAPTQPPQMRCTFDRPH